MQKYIENLQLLIDVRGMAFDYLLLADDMH